MSNKQQNSAFFFLIDTERVTGIASLTFLVVFKSPSPGLSGSAETRHKSPENNTFLYAYAASFSKLFIDFFFYHNHL